MTATRGTTNGNRRGSSSDRRRRREWLVENYRANVDVLVRPSDVAEAAALCGITLEPWQLRVLVELPLGVGEHACRCFRCGLLLTVDTVTVDRIIPGCQGGTYRRNNIRPACSSCNSETGGATRSKIKKGPAHA